MKLTMILFSALMLISSCCDSEKSFDCQCDNSYQSYNDSIVNLFSSDKGYIEQQNKYYYLAPISDADQEIYRLEMNHSFSRYIQFYTLSKTNSGALLEVLQYDQKAEDGARFDKKYEAHLTREQWKIIRDKINATCYWTNKIGKDRCKNCLDGGSWVLQGYDPQSRNCSKRAYHVDLCDFDSKSELGDLCRINRTFVKEDKLNVYTDGK
jgi:hypothetical protein